MPGRSTRTAPSSPSSKALQITLTERTPVALGERRLRDGRWPPRCSCAGAQPRGQSGRLANERGDHEHDEDDGDGPRRDADPSRPSRACRRWWVPVPEVRVVGIDLVGSERADRRGHPPTLGIEATDRATVGGRVRERVHGLRAKRGHGPPHLRAWRAVTCDDEGGSRSSVADRNVRCLRALRGWPLPLIARCVVTEGCPEGRAGNGGAG